MSFVDVLPEAHLPQGQQRTVTLQGQRILLCHSASGVFAIEDKCPHIGMPLCGGVLEGDVIRCPSHNATFDLRDGKPTRARRLSSVRCYAVQVKGGQIAVDPDSAP